MNQNTLDQLASKRKFVAVFVSIAVVGVILISIAVYKASKELEIVDEIDNMYRLTASRIYSDTAHPDERLSELIKMLTTNEYQLFVMRRDEYLDFGLANQSLAPYIVPADLEKSRINEHGGYLDDNGKIITWVQIPYAGLSVIAAHEFSTEVLGALAYVYPKRLLIPAVFYIWMTVWGALIIGYLMDRLRTQKQFMEHMALHDALTQLPNRNLLADRLTMLTQLSERQDKPFALALVDMDKFKDINDTFGHHEGDSLLKQIACRLNSVLREQDTVARLGGDEFIILMPDVDERSCRVLFRRITEVLNRDYDLGGEQLHVGCSIGIAIYPQHGCNEDELMRAADQAMYKAKSEGGDVRIYKEIRPGLPLIHNEIHASGT